MTEPCSSTARVNSPEEMPNSSSLVWFLSELFPVGRGLQSAARSASMNHLNIDYFFFFFLLLKVTLSCSADAFIQKKIKCAQRRKELKFHKRQDYEEPAVRRSKVRVVVFMRYVYGAFLHVRGDGVWQRMGEWGKEWVQGEEERARWGFCSDIVFG